MTEFSKEIFLRALDEWARYPREFGKLPAQQQADFLKEQGYESVRDLLTHVAAWWEEGRSIVTNTLMNRDPGGRQYDLDAFNAAALKRFDGLSANQFTTWYESEHRQMAALVSGLTVMQLGLSRVRGWLDAVLLEHLKEHGFDAPRFLVLDILRRAWGDFRPGYLGLTAEKQAEYLQKQGFARFADVLAHILAWWERGIVMFQENSAEDPNDVDDVDALNAQAVTRFGDLDERLVGTQYEKTRLTLVSLIDMLPDEVIERPNIQGWLRADVIDHYYEHAV